MPSAIISQRFADLCRHFRSAASFARRSFPLSPPFHAVVPPRLTTPITRPQPGVRVVARPDVGKRRAGLGCRTGRPVPLAPDPGRAKPELPAPRQRHRRRPDCIASCAVVLGDRLQRPRTTQPEHRRRHRSLGRRHQWHLPCLPEGSEHRRREFAGRVFRPDRPGRRLSHRPAGPLRQRPLLPDGRLAPRLTLRRLLPTRRVRQR